MEIAEGRHQDIETTKGGRGIFVNGHLSKPHTYYRDIWKRMPAGL